jgi:hypothetical protein
MAESPSGVPNLIAKDPSQNIECGDSHANAEEHTVEGSLWAAFANGEGQACNHNGDEREAVNKKNHEPTAWPFSGPCRKESCGRLPQSCPVGAEVC